MTGSWGAARGRTKVDIVIIIIIIIIIIILNPLENASLKTPGKQLTCSSGCQ